MNPVIGTTPNSPCPLVVPECTACILAIINAATASAQMMRLSPTAFITLIDICHSLVGSSDDEFECDPRVVN